MGKFAQRQGQTGVVSKQYVSRASFWAIVLHFKLEVS